MRKSCLASVLNFLRKPDSGSLTFCRLEIMCDFVCPSAWVSVALVFVATVEAICNAVHVKEALLMIY